MKFFKSTLAIAALLIANPMFAARATTTAKKAAPAPKGKAAAQPVAVTAQTGQTYPQLMAFVKGARDAWDNNQGLLSSSFGQAIMEKALAANLDALQFDALLQTARDYHAKFTDNQQDNINLLQRLEGQRKTAVDAFIGQLLSKPL